MDLDWTSRAKCDGQDTEVYDSRNFGQGGYAYAKALCEGCPVLAQCARWAYRTGASHYVYAGIALGPVGTNDVKRRKLAGIAGIGLPHNQEDERAAA